MNGKKLVSMTEQIYNIVSGADNRAERAELTGAIEEWLQWYDGDESAADLASEFQEYYNQHD